MPYIPKDQRPELDVIVDHIVMLLNSYPQNIEGKLNYLITRTLFQVYGTSDNTSYQNINNAMGLLDCVSKEYYRKVAEPYENQKQFENGDVLD